LFIVYSFAQSPSEYCNKKESPALQLPVDQDGNSIYDPDILESIHVPIDPNIFEVPLFVGGKFNVKFKLKFFDYVKIKNK